MNSRNKLFLLLVIVLVIISGFAFDFYKKAGAMKANPQVSVEQKTEDIVSRLGKLIILPEGETPVIMVVNDIEKLNKDPFFAKAKNGDNVVFYRNSGKIYLYDPVANKVLEIAKINLETINNATNKTINKPTSK